MVTHHPTSNMLLEHAAGTSSWAVSLGISAHLQMCPKCRHQVNHLNHVGGALLMSSTPDAPNSGSFAQLMSEIELADMGLFQKHNHQEEAVTVAADEAGAFTYPNDHADFLQSAPKAIRQLIRRAPNFHWSTITPALKRASLVSETATDMALYRLNGGGHAAGHKHDSPHISLVVSGYASDDAGLYGPGDFIFYPTGQTRRLVATQNQDCIYLSVAQNGNEAYRSGWAGAPLTSVRDTLSGWLSS